MAPPKWRELADQLAAKIRDGSYPVGSTLPRIADFAAEVGTSRNTVHEAYKALEAEGLVISVRGRGTVVRDRTVIRVPLSRYRDVTRSGNDLGPWQTATAAQGLDGRMVMVGEPHLEAAPAEIAEPLGLDPGAAVLRRTRHATIGSDVVQIQRAWYPVDLAVALGLNVPGRIEGGIYSKMIAGGVTPTRADERVTARMPTREEASALSVGSRVPLLLIQRVTRDSEGQALELLHVVGAADRLELIYDGLPLVAPDRSTP